MKQLVTMVGAVLLLTAGVQVIAQDEPGAVATIEMEAVVTVRGVHHVNRTVTVEGPRGERIVIKVPEESQNLYQIQPGAKFRSWANTYGHVVVVEADARRSQSIRRLVEGL